MNNPIPRAMCLLLMLALILWLLLNLLNHLAHTLCERQSRIEDTPNAERRWAYRAYICSRRASEYVTAGMVALAIVLVAH